MVNGSCVQVSCAISGQQSINGICQCVNINSIVQSSSCVCPVNSQVVGIACVCSISGQIMQKGQCVCSTTGAFVQNNICTCGINSFNISNTCSCPTNSSLVNNACTCDKIIGQQIINGSCQCPAGQQVINDSCNYIINVTQFECYKELFTQQFDIQSITNQITSSSNFSAGYVFSTSTTIQNAFIDISNYVYSTTVCSLFQSQNTFTNLKIQFGTQSLNSGSLLLSSSSVSINQMNVISRPGSQLTVNSAKILNIITSSSSSANVTNLLVNLSFAQSSGNISLINNINGIFNVFGYQVLGSYISTGTVAMIGLNINSATININRVSFQPTIYNVGNCSSYLFGNAVTTSTIEINNFAVILGSSSNILLLDSTSSTSKDTNYYLFGGIIAFIKSDLVVSANNIIIDSYHQFSTSYVSYSGFLVGYDKNANSGAIIIKNVCLQQNMASETLQFDQFGLIGITGGNTSFYNVSISFSVQGAYFTYFGIVGIQYVGYVEIANLRTSVNISSGSGKCVGSLFGAEEAINCSVQNASVVQGNLNLGSTQNVGGFFGHQCQNTTIMNSSVLQTNISGLMIGGYVGECNGYLYLINSKIKSVRLTGTNNIVVGYFLTNGIAYFTNSQSTQIYINGVLRSDCAVISNLDGC
ncbi:Conserved_hypothetical protein [Hexamita inflata]|uniref:Uncharacterized protein n=1 Tax=Hexamita inflata TaxID=28002 RepID=A0AA86QW23_9EUKA|nr:Conserved hypothetical protein [Hexamita inflata]